LGRFRSLISFLAVSLAKQGIGGYWVFRMKLVPVLWALAFGVAMGCSTRSPEPKSSYLFNGRDLTGWVVTHGGEWSVEGGILVGRNGANWSTDPEVSGSWLRTEREYGDFILDLEYAIEGNSGVFLRSALEKNPAFTGYEMQIVSDHGRPPSKGSAGSLYDVVAATRNMSRLAGEWNKVRILCEGERIQVIWNGELTLDFEEATRSRRGYIGLQNHDEKSVVRFRNIRISEL
jgi:hypothetical protein